MRAGLACAAIRNDCSRGFSLKPDGVPLELEGNPIPLPREDWPKEKEYYNMSPERILLLYRETIGKGEKKVQSPGRA